MGTGTCSLNGLFKKSAHETFVVICTGCILGPELKESPLGLSVPTYSKLLCSALCETNSTHIFFEANCLQKKQRGEKCPWSGCMVVGLVCAVYLLITARLVLCGEAV